MKKVLLIILILVSGCVSTTNMKLTSNDFGNNENLPSLFTCDGSGISPHLEWSGFPKETKSFALILNDPDAPSGNFRHWIIYNIPKNITSIEQGDSVGIEVENDARKTSYFGPCPPSGTHRYVFTIYALKVEHLDGINKDNFVSIVEKNKLDSAKLIGLYKRK